jgi:translocation and assembly module TamA
VGTITVTGTTSFGDAPARSGFGLVSGAPFTDAGLNAAVEGLRTAYLRAGYLDVEIASSAEVKKDRARVDLVVTVKEGARSVIRNVRIVNAGETSPHLVSRTLSVEPDRPVDPIALDAAQQRLYDTGIFQRVDIEVRPLDPALGDGVLRAAEAVVSLEERPTYRLRYGVQFGPTTIDNITSSTNTASPGASVDLQRRNMFGQGIVVGAGGVWSADQHRVRATLATATLRGRAVSTNLTVEHADQDRVSEDVIQVIDRSARSVVEQRWRFGRVRRVELAYGFDVDHRRLELQATAAEPLPLRGRLASLNATFTYDSRDNRFNPRRGMFHTSRVESGAGWWLSDVAFGRYLLQQFVYYPVGKVTLASGLRFGSLDVDNEREPISLLLFFKTGGGTSVRGYEADSLTPGYVLGVPTGGKVLFVLNQELRVPLTRRVGVVGFVDAGNTFRGLDSFDLGGLKVGVGSGLRLDTPVAVLRVDVAAAVPGLAGGPRARWYFSLGQAF